MIFSPIGVVLFTLTAFPVTYGYNYILKYTGDNHWTVFGVAVAVLIVLCFVFYILSKLSDQNERPSDPLFYVFLVLSFTALVDLIISLEIDGYIHGFMEFYLKEGEPYLNTAHGKLCVYWDGTVHYVTQMSIAIRCLQKKNYDHLALYWSGSLGNIVLVYILGTMTGSHAGEIKASFLLTVPYLIIPVVIGCIVIRRRMLAVKFDNRKVRIAYQQDILTRPMDILLITYLIFSTFITVIRGLAALDCTWPSVQNYVTKYEPYIGDPIGYPRIQMLVYLLYFVPFYAFAIYGLVVPGNTWMLNWSLIYAGVTSQSQIIHLCAAFHKLTRPAFHPPRLGREGFILVNISLQVIPQLLAWRCNNYPEIFAALPEDSSDTVKAKKE
ncbi:transmembrane 6 superfamily member 1-like [Saccoglossus kowalevskii]|uniref:Transmembrane 6 superfamily member 1-like n=1 Tax=Saccoglossus kowalevskii TaxID=10224 RepID=A0ABM0M8C9_SACKO|nr:PREDICTED: transmembrane 6 superfamily member 1-like [Saccoglossus kowalevskii]